MSDSRLKQCKVSFIRDATPCGAVRHRIALHHNAFGVNESLQRRWSFKIDHVLKHVELIDPNHYASQDHFYNLAEVNGSL